MTDASPEDDAPANEPAAAPSRVPWIVAAVAAVVALVLGVLFVQASADADDRGEQLAVSDARAADEQALRLAASGFVEALLGYDHTDLPGWRDDVLARSGGAFAEAFPELYTSILEPLYAELQGSSAATVRDTYVSQVDGDTATVVVLLDYTTTGAVTGPSTATDIYFSISLQRVDGEWLVVENPLRVSGTASNPFAGGTDVTTDTTPTTAPG